jgi:fatty-acyl-CoA synthase
MGRQEERAISIKQRSLQMSSRHPAPYWPADIPRAFELPERTIDANLEITAERSGDAVAIIYQGREVGYAELWQKVLALAGYLQQRAGVKKGDRVLLYMQNSPQWIISYYAILRAGAVVVPVNPMNRTGELEYLVTDTGGSVMLIGQELAAQVQPLLESGQIGHVICAAYAEMGDPDFDCPLPDPLPSLKESDFTGPGICGFAKAIQFGETPRVRETGPDDMAVIPYSSGTTGQPKGCVHTHRTVMVTIVGGIVWNPAVGHTVNLATLPFFHVTGMQSSMNQPIYQGGTIVILTRWNCVHASRLIERYRVSRWASISTMMIDLLNNPATEAYDLSSLDKIGGGGAAMPDAIAKKLRVRIGRPYIEGYGLSETIAGTHINPVDAPRDQCLGVPVFDVDARVVEPGGTKELDLNVPGEIVMSAPQVFKGYWGKPEATAEAFVEIDGKSFFRTGDIAYRDESGFFYMVDRLKRMVNISGFKVWPAEVEMLMLKNKAIAEACVVPGRDERRGEFVKAFVVRAKSSPDIDADSIIAWCREEMAAYKCPSEVVFIDQLPRSGAGKVLWRELI